jgi:DNA-binding transcriptional regulator GbsR (MarR family)
MTTARRQRAPATGAERGTPGAPAPPDPRSPAALVEEMGDLFARTGAQRISGRIVGWLLVCVPEHQTAAEIQSAVRASKGSVSTVLRQLVELGLVERLGLPGDRRTYFRVRADGWTLLFEAKMRLTLAYRELAERWAERLRSDPERAVRVAEMARLYGFFGGELGKAMNRWRQRAPAGRS